MARINTKGYKPVPPVCLSQLGKIKILWPGDVRMLAEFMLRCYDANDKIENAKNKGSVRKSRPTVHFLACEFARLSGTHSSVIENIFHSHGLNLGATVEFDELKIIPTENLDRGELK